MRRDVAVQRLDISNCNVCTSPIATSVHLQLQRLYISNCNVCTIPIAAAHAIFPDSEAEINKTFTQLTDSTYLYLDEVEIEVPEHLKAVFLLIIEDDISKTGWFAFINEKRIRLTDLN